MLRTSRSVLLLASLALVPIARAEERSLEARLKALEDRVQALEAENAKLKADAAPEPAAPAVVKAAGKEHELKVGGLLQVQAEAGGRADARFSDDNDRVFLRRARVNVGGRFLDDFEWKTELELAGTLQNAPGLRAQLTDAWIAWKRKKPFEVRVGQFKTPFGWEQLSHDPRLACAERSLGSDRLTLGRQIGVQLGGSALDDRFSWSVGGFNGVASNQSGNDDDRFLLAARVSGTLASWRAGKTKEAHWSLGLDAYDSRDASVTLAPEFKFDSNPGQAGTDNVFAGRRGALGADTQLAIGPFELDGEWLQADYRPNDDLPSGDFDARSRMAQAVVMAWKDRLQFVARWDDFDPDRARDDDAWRTWTTGVAWLIRGHDLKLQANWMDVNGPAPDGQESKLIVRFQVGF